MIVRLVNRSCRVQPNAIDRIALQAIEKLVGPAGQPDPDLEHPDIQAQPNFDPPPEAK